MIQKFDIAVIVAFYGNVCSGAPDEENMEEEEEFDWEIEQTLQKENVEDSLCPSGSYGFGSQKSGVFKRLQVSGSIK